MNSEATSLDDFDSGMGLAREHTMEVGMGTALAAELSCAVERECRGSEPGTQKAGRDVETALHLLMLIASIAS